MFCGLTAGVRLVGVARDAVVLGLVAAAVEVGAGLPRIAGVGWARDRDAVAVAGVLAAGAGWGVESAGGAPSADVVSVAGGASAAGVSVAGGPEMGGIETGGMDGVNVAFGGMTG